MIPKSEMRLHFVGIGGIGMSGIAAVFLNQGYPVSGSDLAESDSTRHLAALGARISIGHREDHVQGARVVVISSAVRADNPEVVEARRQRIPVIRRAEMLGELMRNKTGVAIAGTHGKTTTTSMLATILTVAGLDPTLVIGGKVDSLGGNAKLGKGQYVVAEADESDGSFLHLPAAFAAVTNIDNDHLDHFGSLAEIENAFVEFLAKIPFYGRAVLCAEDPGVRRILGRVTKPFTTFGFAEEWDFSARAVKVEGMGSAFEVYCRAENRVLGTIRLNVPGDHNVLNALAAAVVALEMGLEFERVAEGLAEFRGVKRRFEVRWRDETLRQAVVDDYGHHPTEVAATLAAARGFWPGRIIVVFQPHRYSRTLHCHDGFMNAFRHCDRVLLTDIYAAGEEPIEGVSAELLAQAIQRVAPQGQGVQYAGSLDNACREVVRALLPGDLVLCLGAGTITRLPDQIVAAMPKAPA